MSASQADGEDEYKRINKIKKVLSYGCKGLQLPFMIIAIVASSKIKSIYSITADAMCSDSITNNFFCDLSKLMTEDVYSNNI